MNITIISNNYFPEDSGIGLYSTGLSEFLAADHQVKVIAATPYYPQWKIYPDYRDKPTFSSEIINGVEIFRFKQYTPENPTLKGRILQMLHFFFGSLRNAFKIKKNDVVIVIMPFTVSVVLGWFIKKLRGGKLWIHIQDFEFDAAFETGISSKKGFFSKLVFKIESMLLNRADYVSTISQGMLKKLQSKSTSQTYYFPNWIDYNKINPATANVSEIFKKDQFNILYSGNIGAKQDWDFFIEFAKECSAVKNVHITLIGDGAKCEDVVNTIGSFENISYYPPVRYEELNDVLCTADLHILFQKDTVVDTVMPSKILGMMASARPSLVTGYEESEVKTNFEISQGGFYYSGNEKMKNCIETVQRLSENSDLCIATGDNARKFIIEQYSIEKILGNFQQKIESLQE